jgi:hypothetical protein
MNTYGGVDVYIHVFLNWALGRGEWSASRLGKFIPVEKAPCTYWIGCWLGLRVDLDDMVKWRLLTASGLKLRPLGFLSYSHSLCRLRYAHFSDSITCNRRNKLDTKCHKVSRTWKDSLDKGPKLRKIDVILWDFVRRTKDRFSYDNCDRKWILER